MEVNKEFLLNYYILVIRNSKALFRSDGTRQDYRFRPVLRKSKLFVLFLSVPGCFAERHESIFITSFLSNFAQGQLYKTTFANRWLRYPAIIHFCSNKQT